MMVFVPVAMATALTLRAGAPLPPARGFAVTPSLRRALGPATDDEEADFAVLSAAGVAALDGLVGSRRLVLAAEVPDGQVRDRGSELGEVDVRDVAWRQVQALFADEGSAGPAVAAAASAASGLALAAAFDLPAVIELSDTVDLLWYAPEELDELR
jgi:hypothetical protein